MVTNGKLTPIYTVGDRRRGVDGGASGMAGPAFGMIALGQRPNEPHGRRECDLLEQVVNPGSRRRLYGATYHPVSDPFTPCPAISPLPAYERQHGETWMRSVPWISFPRRSEPGYRVDIRPASAV